jgi:hypothetical protein
MQDPMDAAHEHCFHNESEALASPLCGCFFCCLIFPPGQISRWLTEAAGGERTAFCPRCDMDTVIGSASGYPISADFMKQMQRRWFNEMAEQPEGYFDALNQSLDQRRTQERGGETP